MNGVSLGVSLSCMPAGIEQKREYFKSISLASVWMAVNKEAVSSLWKRLFFYEFELYATGSHIKNNYFFLEAEFLALGIAAAGFEEGFPKFTAPFAGLFAMVDDFKIT